MIREQEALNRLDHRDPLVFDTRELGRRPGSMKRVSRTISAPADLGVEVIGVPEGATVELEMRLESVMEGVLVTGTATAPLKGECVRCLDPLERELEAEFQEMYSYPDADDRGSDAEEGDEEEVLVLEGDMFDLEPVLRDAVVLALPLQPVCREDCLGLCSECGARLSDDPGHHHETVDIRWAALQGFAASAEDGEKDEPIGGREAPDENQEK
ncbi:YceD family protein [Wenjunlia tyrosinilytica]|jgi:uncharacterized protein|uniref:DUF177 domain-containing protein n=1 Tax=Wenjunlia tyrosinilytica TaxID=1544741 RepID=A0A918E087_9ACTN|nr:YceD family protein [Wenjunlia tyrosinilytica]GGO93839.1 hypothetical protein GCM10012280_47280 [Wenjunlia tyrosinilytica]